MVQTTTEVQLKLDKRKTSKNDRINAIAAIIFLFYIEKSVFYDFLEFIL